MTELKDIILGEIAGSGPITFARFMELALYHPEYGYYASGRAKLGRSGDFYTNTHIGPLFGRLICESYLKMRDRLGAGPVAFVEMGGGDGYFARDFIESLVDRSAGRTSDTEYIIVENSRGMREKQAETLGHLSRMVTWYDSVEEIPGMVNGVFFSNELVDALPFHRVCNMDSTLMEVFVDTDGAGGFVDKTGPVSTREIPMHLNRIGVRVPVGVTTEVCLEASRWIGSVAEKLAKGFIVTVDYGYPANEYYSPERSNGTIACYHGHRRSDDPYRLVGEQDITAHVDFSSLAQQGMDSGLYALLYADQTSFLADAVTSLEYHMRESGASPERLEELGRGLKPLIHPEWMGGAFNVLVQSKGVGAEGIFDGVRNRTGTLWDDTPGGSYSIL